MHERSEGFLWRPTKAFGSYLPSMLVPTLHVLVHALSHIDWLKSLKQFFINVSYHILVASLTLMALKTEPSELDWLQVYDMTH